MLAADKIAALRTILDAAGQGGAVSAELVRETIDSIVAQHPFVMMTADRARDLTKTCLRNAMARNGLTDGDYVPLPADVSLEEVLAANRLVSDVADVGKIKNADGTTTVLMTVDPRGTAAAYAFEQYQRSPERLLNAVGYSLRPDEDDDGED